LTIRVVAGTRNLCVKRARLERSNVQHTSAAVEAHHTTVRGHLVAAGDWARGIVDDVGGQKAAIKVVGVHINET
jgi:hypothetical protein